MEVRNNNPINSRPQEAQQFDLTRPTRKAIDKLSPEQVTEVPSKDAVMVSRTAQQAIASEVRIETRTDDQQQRIDDLKALHQRGTLNTPERIAQAAAKMLVQE